MRTSLIITLALFLASLAGALLAVDGEAVWSPSTGAMLAVGHLVMTTIVVVAALVGAARWSVPLGIGLAAALAVVAVAHPVTPVSVVMIVLAGGAAAGLIGTGLRGTVRLRPAADGPPRKASVLTLSLIATPLLVGGLQPSGVGWPDWALAGAAMLLAGWYAQARPGALLLVRALCPTMALVSAFVIPFPEATVAIAAAGALTWLAWSKDVRLAVHPIAAPGTAVPIPAELTPREILDAAGLDERGRREEGS